MDYEIRVYCKNCRHHHKPTLFSANAVSHMCKRKEVFQEKDSPIKEGGGYFVKELEEFCYRKNEKNDCKDFRRKWWKFWYKPVIKYDCVFVKKMMDVIDEN